MRRLAILPICLILVLVYGFTNPYQPAVAASGSGVKSDTLNLEAYKGRILILNFWASWSKASRAENKNLLRIYQVYRLNHNVAFASVSLDTDESAWKQAISEDELTFKDHFCDYRKYASPMAQKLGVTTLPRFFVYDKEGHQVLNAANSHQVEQLVADLLKK